MALDLKGHTCKFQNLANTLSELVKTELSFSNKHKRTEVAITFRRYLHAPPAPNLKNYGELARRFWNNVVLKLGYAREATNVTLGTDKEDICAYKGILLILNENQSLVIHQVF